MALSKDSIHKLKLLKHLMNWHWLYFPRVRFNLGVWAERRDNTGFCNTAACAVGSAMLWKPFNTMGLNSVYPIKEGHGRPKYGNYINWEAVEKFFDISVSQAEFLFSANSYPDGRRTTARMVAKRIKQFIKTNK